MTQEEQNQRHGIAKPAKLYVIAVLTASLPGVVFAGDLPVPHPASDVTVTDPITDYFLHWFDRSEVAKGKPAALDDADHDGHAPA